MVGAVAEAVHDPEQSALQEPERSPGEHCTLTSPPLQLTSAEQVASQSAVALASTVHWGGTNSTVRFALAFAWAFTIALIAPVAASHAACVLSDPVIIDQLSVTPRSVAMPMQAV